MSEYQNPRLRVAIIVHDDNERVLLLQHTRPHGKYWVLPGGGVDTGECIEDAIIREMQEELGVGCEVDRLVAVGELIEPGRHVVDFFLTGKIERFDSFNIQTEEGISDARWYGPDELADIPLLPPEIIPVLISPNPAEKAGIIYLGRYGKRQNI